MKRLAAWAVIGAAAAGGAGITAAQTIGGVKPAHLDAVTESVPNVQALGRRIWTPGLDEGYVPQGLTNADGYLLVSSYLPSPDLKSNTGPCRVFRIELAKALATGKAEGAMKAVKIAGELRGSYATFDGKDAWIGTWTKEEPHARMFRLDPRLFDDYEGQTVREERAVESIPVPLEAQGAAFDRSGNLWVSASSGQWGRLYRLDRQGKVLARYEMTAGLEDLTVDANGRLWGLSESGTRKYLHWATRFPFIFEIDPGKLQ